MIAVSLRQESVEKRSRALRMQEGAEPDELSICKAWRAEAGPRKNTHEALACDIASGKTRQLQVPLHGLSRN